MSIHLNDNLKIQAPKLIDDRFGPHDNLSAALAFITPTLREMGLIFFVKSGINLLEYWWPTTDLSDSGVALRSYQPLDADLTSIADIVDAATGFLKKTAPNTWSLDTTVATVSTVGGGSTNYIPRFASAFALINSAISDDGSLVLIERNTRINGRIGLGENVVIGTNIQSSMPLTGTDVVASFRNSGITQNDVTTSSSGFLNDSATAPNTTITTLIGFHSRQGTIGAGSSVTNQYGFFADASLIGAGRNLAFIGFIPNGPLNFNAYMAGTAPNYFAGNTLIGNVINDGANILQVTGNQRITGRLGVGLTPNFGIDVSGSGVGGMINQVRTGLNGAGLAATVTFGSDAKTVNDAVAINFNLHNSSSTSTGYGRITTTIISPTAGDHSGRISIQPTNLGIFANGVSIWNDGALTVNQLTNNGIDRLQVSGSGLFTSSLTASISALGTAATTFLTHTAGLIQSRTASQVLADIGAAASLSGTVNAVPRFITSSTLGNSSISDNGTNVIIGLNTFITGLLGINTSLPQARIHVRTTSGQIYSALFNTNSASLAETRIAIGGFQDNAGGTSASAAIGAITQHEANANSIMTFLTSNSGSLIEAGRITSGQRWLFGTNVDNGVDRLQVSGNSLFSGNIRTTGGVYIGSSTLDATVTSLTVDRDITGSTIFQTIRTRGDIKSDVTSSVVGFATSISTQAASFNLADLTHYRASQATFGAGSSVTTQSGFFVNSNMIGATNNYGFRGQIPSGAGRWNLFMDGTANNHFNGRTLFGTTVDNGVDRIQVNGSGDFTGNLAVGGTLAVTGAATFSSTVTATLFTQSDRTMKTSIKADYLIKGIENIRAHLYRKNGVEEIGYYAQDAQPYIPSAVRVGQDGKLVLSYTEVLVAKVASLEARVKELESRLNHN